MGKKIRIESDPKLAVSHKEGAKLIWQQPLLHKNYGTVNYYWPRYLTFHYDLANSAYSWLERTQKEILKIKPSSETNERTITDFKFLEKIYRRGFELIAHTYLCFEHLSEEILQGTGYEQEVIKKRLELRDRVKFIVEKIFLKPELIQDQGFVKLFNDLEQKRHSLNHPIRENVYNADLMKWDNVPLAWIISRKYKDDYLVVRKFFLKLLNLWEEFKSNNQRTTQLKVERGIVFKNDLKKK